MFGTGQNNSGEQRSVSTRIKTLFSDLSCMQMSYWNDNLSLRMSPCTGTNAEGVRQYNYGQRVSTAISAEKCLALYNQIKEVILPEIEAYRKDKTFNGPKNVGVQVNNKGTSVFIEYKQPEDKDYPCVFLKLYTNVGQDNKAPENGVFSYRFNRTAVVLDYDPKEGTGTGDFVEAEFEYFCEKMKLITICSGPVAHANNINEAYKTPSAKPNFQSGYQNGFQNQNNQNSGTQSNYSAPVSSFSGEFDPFTT